MSILDSYSSSLLPFVNDLWENESSFTQVIQLKNEVILDLKFGGLSGIFQNTMPSHRLGIALSKGSEELWFLDVHPEIILRCHYVGKHKLAPP